MKNNGLRGGVHTGPIQSIQSIQSIQQYIILRSSFFFFLRTDGSDLGVVQNTERKNE
jgi:hypothetical protein